MKTKLNYLKRFILREWYKMSSNEHGRFRVMYNDGRMSVAMGYRSAKAYAVIFNGEIVDNF